MIREIEIQVVESLVDVDAKEWNALAGANPFVQHAYLSAMHDTKCASKRTGWQPHYLLLMRGGSLAGAMALYLKAHSRGEYVFDHSWADAFQRHGLRYYPKLLSAVPFTPVTGPRLLANNHDDRVLLARGAIQLARQMDVSSIHVLFSDERDVAAVTDAGYMLREGVQFHWKNDSYANFDAFLATMNQQKRKKIKQDRRHVAEAGVSYQWLRGTEIDAEALDFFYSCYENTYREHWNPPYLTREFFGLIHEAAPESLFLVIAEADGERLACALNIIGDNVMYGRYWGTREFVSGLHFETCYMQGIEYCILNGLDAFEGGAQGVHKMSRGMLPTPTWSAHWIADDRFAHAISEFLDEETSAMDEHIGELEAHTPFKSRA
ncbi:MULTISPECIES: GNAT family N-acetyltransferase [unclassified Caballeronia]|uniref:GNAT family N-acetyltransferase n=1 Tax=unclassified Caballeronia TaxID=2646786 RepID=UPI00285A7139|nr:MULTISPECIES: GNAT family N-acetyltransferase [unclassified Caballeronia]MDR5751361.1 GNAT family N-acetyltransferase [Caballeronia sp. LZ024]MDR5844497.1 GNAT family N-acetyltransferase [Caballeronia sp. LZ031]